MNKLTVNLSTMLLACMAGTVAAKPIDRIIERMDTDGDGRVSREEFNPRRGSPFNRVDGNGDGVVTLDEINQHIADRMAEMAERHAEMQSRMQDFFTGADADGDGMVTREEARAVAFNRIDENSDGYLNKEEMGNAKRRGGGRKHGRRHGGGPGGS